MRVLYSAMVALGLLLSSPGARAQEPELGQGWVPEFQLAGRHLLELAEAIPAEKYSWRPGPGVRSVSEVLMHVVLGNYGLLMQAGGKVPLGTPKLTADLETKTTAKVDVIRWLKGSIDAVAEAYPKTDRTKQMKFLGKDSTSDFVFLRILVHEHEHMGQMIAYSRTIGVRPPWSGAAK